MRFEGYAVKDMASSDPIPEATYRLRIKEFDFADPGNPEWKKENANSKAKHPYLDTTFVVLDEVEAKSGAVVLGRHLFVNLTMKKGGDWLLRQLVEAAGKPDDWELDTDELVDAEVMGVVTIQPERVVDGQKYDAKNEIKRFASVL